MKSVLALPAAAEAHRPGVRLHDLAQRLYLVQPVAAAAQPAPDAPAGHGDCYKMLHVVLPELTIFLTDLSGDHSIKYQSL